METEQQVVHKVAYQLQLKIQIYSKTCVKRPYKQTYFWPFQTGGCLLLSESSTEINVLSKNMKNIIIFHLKIIFFKSREKLKYITWACFGNALNHMNIKLLTFLPEPS